MHLSVSWQDFSTLAKNGYLYDDSFYAFQISRNIAEGNGVTFDGATPTNGFQPLYVFLLVPAFKLMGPDRIAPIYAALSLMALLTAATALLLLLIARRYVSDAVAIFAATVWVFSPVVVRQTANGLETVLALFLIAWSVYYYLEKVRNNPQAGLGRYLCLGLLLGFTILARVDGILFVFVMALDYLLVMRGRARGGETKNSLRGFGVAVAAAFAVCLPWAVYGLAAVGSMLPQSGTATRFLSIAYAPFFGLESAGLRENGPGLSFMWAHLLHAFSVLKISPPIHVFYRAVEKLNGEPGGGSLLVLVNSLGFVALAAFVVWMVRCRRSLDTIRRGEVTFLLLFSLLLVAAYSTYIFGVFFFTRYLYPVYFVATVFAACILQDVKGWVTKKPLALRTAAVFLFGLYAVGIVYMGFTSGFRSSPVYHFYDVAEWVGNNTSEHETIGVFQGGAIGYFSNRRVVNLDGKVNGDALHALQQGKISDYIQQAGINVVIDHESVLNLFLGPCKDDDLAGIGVTKFFNGSIVGALGWVGFRLHNSGAGAGILPSDPTGNNPPLETQTGTRAGRLCL